MRRPSLPSHRRSPGTSVSALESLEHRRLLTVDLTIGNIEIGFFNSLTPGPGDAVTINASIFSQKQNLGNTAADLRNGTPTDDSDNVIMQFFISSDNVLDGGDLLVGDHNLGAFNAQIAANSSIESTDLGAASFQPGPNANFIIAKIDATNVLAETNENNNVKAIDIRNVVLNVTGSGGQVTRKNRLFSVNPGMNFVDGNTTNYNTGRITASILAPQTKDALQFIKNGSGSERLKVSGSNLKLGNQVIATVTGNKSTGLEINFTADVDQSVVFRVLRNIGFKTRTDSPATRTINFELQEPQSGPTSTDQKVVNIDFQ